MICPSPLHDDRSTVSMRVLRPLFEAAMRAGATPEVLARATGLSPASLDSLDARIDLEQLFAVLERILEATGDPAFGLHCLPHLPRGSFDPVTALVFHAVDLRASMESMQRYLGLLATGVSIALHHEGDDVCIRTQVLPEAPVPVRRLASELMVCGLYHRVRFFCPDARFHGVHFPHPAPAYRDEYSRVFDGPMYFDQAFTGLTFDAALLDARSPLADAELHATLRSLGERKLRCLDQARSHAQRVREVILRHEAPRHASMARVARALCLSERSLRRRLAEEGTSFARISDDAVADIARAALSEGTRSIQEVAFMLGFADAASFHRAFKRWTGMTPTAFCRRQSA